MTVPSHIEAINARLPEVKEIFEGIHALNKEAAALNTDIQSLFEIWGEHVREPDNPDNNFFTTKEEKKHAIGQEIQAGLQRIASIGGVVKDISKGLVDFRVDGGGELIFLCWELGEEKILHWHPARGGFTARRPIEELLHASSV